MNLRFSDFQMFFVFVGEFSGWESSFCASSTGGPGIERFRVLHSFVLVYSMFPALVVSYLRGVLQGVFAVCSASGLSLPL